MFRKNEVACEEWSPENVQLCADRQDGILECAAQMLVPGGRLVYSTCTFAPAEDEGSACRFLAAHPEFHPECFDAPEGAGFGNVPMATLLPQKHGTDGFFICKLRRDA